MARTAVGNAEDALDIVQDAMLQLARKYAQHDPQEWGGLFHQILQRRIYDFYRRTRVRNRWRTWLGTPDNFHEDPMENISDNRPDPAACLTERQTQAALERALKRLPLRQKQAFLLRVWEGFDVEQTARAMGCTAGSVKTHYSRAIHSLRELLKDRIL